MGFLWMAAASQIVVLCASVFFFCLRFSRADTAARSRSLWLAFCVAASFFFLSLSLIFASTFALAKNDVDAAGPQGSFRPRATASPSVVGAGSNANVVPPTSSVSSVLQNASSGRNSPPGSDANDLWMESVSPLLTLCRADIVATINFIHGGFILGTLSLYFKSANPRYFFMVFFGFFLTAAHSIAACWVAWYGLGAKGIHNQVDATNRWLVFVIALCHCGICLLSLLAIRGGRKFVLDRVAYDPSLLWLSSRLTSVFDGSSIHPGTFNPELFANLSSLSAKMKRPIGLLAACLGVEIALILLHIAAVAWFRAKALRAVPTSTPVSDSMHGDIGSAASVFLANFIESYTTGIHRAFIISLGLGGIRLGEKPDPLGRILVDATCLRNFTYAQLLFGVIHLLEFLYMAVGGATFNGILGPNASNPAWITTAIILFAQSLVMLINVILARHIYTSATSCDAEQSGDAKLVVDLPIKVKHAANDGRCLTNANKQSEFSAGSFRIATIDGTNKHPPSRESLGPEERRICMPMRPSLYRVAANHATYTLESRISSIRAHYATLFPFLAWHLESVGVLVLSALYLQADTSLARRMPMVYDALAHSTNFGLHAVALLIFARYRSVEGGRGFAARRRFHAYTNAAFATLGVGSVIASGALAPLASDAGVRRALQVFLTYQAVRILCHLVAAGSFASLKLEELSRTARGSCESGLRGHPDGEGLPKQGERKPSWVTWFTNSRQPGYIGLGSIDQEDGDEEGWKGDDGSPPGTIPRRESDHEGSFLNRRQGPHVSQSSQPSCFEQALWWTTAQIAALVLWPLSRPPTNSNTGSRDESSPGEHHHPDRGSPPPPLNGLKMRMVRMLRDRLESLVQHPTPGESHRGIAGLSMLCTLLLILSTLFCSMVIDFFGSEAPLGIDYALDVRPDNSSVPTLGQHLIGASGDIGKHTVAFGFCFHFAFLVGGYALRASREPTRSPLTACVADASDAGNPERNSALTSGSAHLSRGSEMVYVGQCTMASASTVTSVHGRPSSPCHCTIQPGIPFLDVTRAASQSLWFLTLLHFVLLLMLPWDASRSGSSALEWLAGWMWIVGMGSMICFSGCLAVVSEVYESMQEEIPVRNSPSVKGSGWLGNGQVSYI